ncbi:2-oxoglutarate receptor 1 isoform X2 [Nothobranchius furzeri]|uniref:2-oxoglutarate receptor 1 isoform X2 n=1 Tax=Nothobranchius furzeri TaxID=105023 RepID=UPI002403D29C|nr:2-oxoglutarate receptor 1 isoform X2 [Nothobranchius furzeri]
MNWPFSFISSAVTQAGLATASMNSNCTDLDSLLKLYYLPASYGIIFVFGLVGNIISISIYLTKLRPWKSSSIIMVNLALTDLLYVLTMPFLVHYYGNEDFWMLGDFTCRFVRFAFHFHLYGSILFLSCVAVFRYMVVIQPLRVVQLQQKCWGIAACSAVWIIAAAEISPMLTIISINTENNKTKCLDFASTLPINVVREYDWVLTILGFFLPLVLVFTCYIGVVKQLSNGPGPSSSGRKRARRVTVLVLVVFAICFLPYHILRVLWIEIQSTTMSCMKNIVHAAYIISRPVAGFNTFFNLALYTLSGDKFRRAFLGCFHSECWSRRCKL